MGVVYRAGDQSLGRTVAVKMFHESAADAARTTSETRLLAALNHPSLVTLFDAQNQEGQPHYLVMEYVDGPTLKERISEGPLLSDDVAVMAKDLAEALHIVHSAGIVHRDIKPSNVLLHRSQVPGESHRAKLADFGIAHLIDSTRLTTPGTFVGTAAYLSPEQVQGAEPATASDIYALGLVLIEALTGQRAFPQTGTYEAALARLTRDPIVPGSYGYGWRSLLTAMTTRDPAQRPSALDIVLAAGQLNDSTANDSTAALGALPTAPMSAAAESATMLMTPTRTLPMLHGAPPQLTPTPEQPREHDGAQASPASSRAPSRGRRWHVVIAVLALIMVISVVEILVWMLGASHPADVPALPALNGPLGTHMQNLLDTVTP